MNRVLSFVIGLFFVFSISSSFAASYLNCSSADGNLRRIEDDLWMMGGEMAGPKAKWFFHRQEVQGYIEEFHEETQVNLSDGDRVGIEDNDGYTFVTEVTILAEDAEGYEAPIAIFDDEGEVYETTQYVICERTSRAPSDDEDRF
jgi:hypothetical protein